MSTNDYKPDCGYAWMVVVACFCINFIMAGLSRAAGVLYIALIDSFAVSREIATTPFSLRFCIRNMSGPLVGALGQRFGIRPVVLLGGIVSGIGGIICSVAPSVTWITMAWGVIHGLGYGMCNIIHVIILNRYFDKYKCLALGISLTGDCIGTFLLPVLMEFLLSQYDLRGTFLILAAISLNIVPAAMLLRSPSWKYNDKSILDLQHLRKLSIRDLNNYSHGIDNKAFESAETDIYSLYSNENVVLQHKNSTNEREIIMKRNSSVVAPLECTPLKCVADEHKMIEIPDMYVNDILHKANEHDINVTVGNGTKKATNLKLFNRDHGKNRYKFSLPVYNMNRKNSNISAVSCPSNDNKLSVENICKCEIKRLSNGSLQITDKPSALVGVLNSNVIDSNQNDVVSIIRTTFSEKLSRKHASQQNNAYATDFFKFDFNAKFYENDENSTVIIKPNAIKQFFRTNIKPIFLLISATMALYVFLFISIFTIIIDYASDNGIPTDIGKYLLISFSITDLFGRLGFGVALDKRWISHSHYAGLTTSLMGFFIFVIPFSSSFVFWMISFSICGFVQGGNAIMYPILVEHYMEKEEESVALGCLNFYGGLLMLPIPAMIGYFRDHIGYYDGVFWTTGGLCIFSGLLWLLEPCLIRLQPKKESQNLRTIDLNNHIKDNQVSTP